MPLTAVAGATAPQKAAELARWTYRSEESQVSDKDKQNLALLAASQKVTDKAKAWRADPPDSNIFALVCDLRDAVDELIELEKAK